MYIQILLYHPTSRFTIITSINKYQSIMVTSITTDLVANSFNHPTQLNNKNRKHKHKENTAIHKKLRSTCDEQLRDQIHRILP